MTKQDIFILSLTFVTGLFLGAYLYVTAFAPQFATDNLSKKSEVVISGEMYGGCDKTKGCASFRITDNRKFQYLKNSSDRKKKGTISDDLNFRLSDQLFKSNFNAWSSPTAIRNCRAYVDGIDYRYTVSFGKENYTLDTCKTNFPFDSELQKVFLDLWKYMDSSTTTYPLIIEKGIGGWLVDRFQNPD